MSSKLLLGVGVGLLLVSVAAAGPKGRKPQGQSGYVVQQMDPDADIRPFESSGHQINAVDSLREEPSQLPDTETRDAAFEAAGLTAAVAGMDELDRDLLYMRAKTMEPEAALRKFPKLKIEQIKRLKKMISEQR